MKMVCWILLGVAVILFLLSVYSKFMGMGSFAFGYAPVSWWRATMAALLFAIALTMVHGDGQATG